jgi:hypothetical protein
VHLFVATPCYGGLVTQRYMQSTIGLLLLGQARGFHVSIELLGYDSLIPRSRNTLLAKFLDTPTATHLMYIDADIGFDPAQVERMLAFDQDLVAGMYPLKLIDWSPSARHRAQGGESLETAPIRFVGAPCEGRELERRDGFVTGLYAGTGFMMIRRQALMQMIAAYPQTRYSATHTRAASQRSEHFYALFDCMIEPETGHYLSEDYTFCRRWRDIGGRIWLDPTGQLYHVGAHDFVGRAEAHLRDASQAAR